MSLDLDTFNAAISEGAAAADELEADHRDAYNRALRSIGKDAIEGFQRSVVLTAAASGWVPPDPDEVLPLRDAERRLRERTERGREEMARAQAEPALAAAGIDFDLKDPLISAMLEGMGVQIAYITEDVRQQIMAVIQSGYEEGLTIDQIVKQLRSEVAGMSAMRASRIARTELLTAKNGASWASCKVTGAAGYKQWMATVDSKTRSTHIDVSGQVRNIDKAFDVGFGRASYPGDPSLPPEERVNCRCTIVYSDDPGGVPGVPRSSDIEAGRGVWEMGRSSVRGTLSHNLRIRTRGVPR